MKSRPSIFLSGVSHEFGSFRDAVEIEIQKKGCFAENQPSFAPDYQTVEAMLRRKLHDADAVIHIVGFRYGAEPDQRPVNKPRRSYTQIEFDIARDRQKPVYVFLSTESSVRDAPKPDEQPEDAKATALQLVHREVVQKTNHLYYTFKDKAELCRLAAGIQSVAGADFNADISRISKYAPAELIGREDELKLLNDAWMKVRRAESPRSHVLTFVALGGEGKTSLVAKWAADLAHQDWPGCDAVFAWSFYSQGTREQLAASPDMFLKEALTFFGDAAMAGSAQGTFDKGRRLAQLVGERRALLILDGLELLQYAPTSPTPGELKDEGLAALLKGLAATSHGLCVVTTQYSIPDLRVYWQTTAPEVKLMRLSKEAGVKHLRSLKTGPDENPLRIRGTQREFEQLVEDVKGHALTLNLIGSYLLEAHAGDIRKRDLVELEEADAEEQGGHAFRVMDAYVRSFETGGKNAEENQKGERALAVLRLLALFDRPATADCLEALWKEPAIPGLTEPLAGISDAHRNIALNRLEEAKLLTVNRDTANRLVSLDSHPLIREYFAKRLREQQPDAWRAAHQQLYEHLCAATPDKPQPTLEDLQPLYQAVAHGCQAGMQQEACDKVYKRRILRGTGSNGFYSRKLLGLFSSDLAAVACFFEKQWGRVSPALKEDDQSWLQNEAGVCLVALGRLVESLEPTRAALRSIVQQAFVRQELFLVAAVGASNLSELELTLGEVTKAVEDAKHAASYADRSGDTYKRKISRSHYANALHQAHHRGEAEAVFRESEDLQDEHQSVPPLLHSVAGFLYCDLLLGAPERAAWQVMLGNASVWPAVFGVPAENSSDAHLPSSPEKLAEETSAESDRDRRSLLIHSCRAVCHRVARTIWWAGSPLDGALDYLTLGRASLYEAILDGSAAVSETTAGADLLHGGATEAPASMSSQEPALQNARRGLTDAVDELRVANQQQFLPLGLLTRAWFRFLAGARTGLESAQGDLEEVWEIAERGPMPLFMADIHLHRARLFFREANYPWESPHADLAEARRLIVKHGYWRRKEELEDAENVILGKSEN